MIGAQPKSFAPRLDPIRFLEHLLPVLRRDIHGKKTVQNANPNLGFGQQPRLKFLGTFDGTVRSQVPWQVPLVDQSRCDHQATVTNQRVFFRTQECDHKAVKRILNPVDAVTKSLCLSNPVIVDVPLIIIKRGVPGPSAQLLAQKSVCNFGFGQAGLQLGPIELRITLTERLRAHIRDRGYPGGLKQLEQARQLMVGMADRKEPIGGHKDSPSDSRFSWTAARSASKGLAGAARCG
jgi:hypothetical protein